MPGIRRTAQAEEDLIDLWLYIAQDNPSAADRLLDEIEDKCSLLAANPRLEVLWFPPGSPELNPQEHVWKAVREAVSHNHRCAKLPELAQAFETHLSRTRFPCSLLDKHGYNDLCDRFK